MYISPVTPRPVSAGAVARRLIVAAGLMLAGLIAAIVVSDSSRMSGLGPTRASARPAPVHAGYFRDPATHSYLRDPATHSYLRDPATHSYFRSQLR
jgi:hypothetical protein